MFTRSPIFVRIQNYGERFAGGAWWLMMAPGTGFVLMGLAILLWPELLAYMVAGVLLFIGVTLLAWSWRMRRAERHLYRRMSPFDRHERTGL
jgi:O-antigen/teichoic acid export membrane protein